MKKIIACITVISVVILGLFIAPNFAITSIVLTPPPALGFAMAIMFLLIILGTLLSLYSRMLTKKPKRLLKDFIWPIVIISFLISNGFNILNVAIFTMHHQDVGFLHPLLIEKTDCLIGKKDELIFENTSTIRKAMENSGINKIRVKVLCPINRSIESLVYKTGYADLKK